MSELIPLEFGFASFQAAHLVPACAIKQPVATSLARLLPASARSLLRPVRERYVRYLRWPQPVWRVCGYGIFDLAGHKIRFEDIADPPHDWWAWRAYKREWERESLALFATMVRPGDTVIDVGAYIGPYTLLASQLVGPSGHVFSFEPDPVARKLLSANIEANRAQNVTVVPVAISNTVGTLYLRGDELGNSVTQTNKCGVVPVDTVTLDAFCANARITPQVLKVDIEGGEAAAFAPGAADRTVSAARLTLVEIHEMFGVEPAPLVERFAALGRQPKYLDSRAAGNYNVAFVSAASPDASENVPRTPPRTVMRQPRRGRRLK